MQGLFETAAASTGAHAGAADGPGVSTVALAYGFAAIGARLGPAEVEALAADLDEDGDGLVSRTDFLAAAKWERKKRERALGLVAPLAAAPPAAAPPAAAPPAVAAASPPAAPPPALVRSPSAFIDINGNFCGGGGTLKKTRLRPLCFWLFLLLLSS